MTALSNLNNIGRAKLLHELFPDEIPQLLDHIKEVCVDLKANREEYQNTWNFGLMTFHTWLSLSEKTEGLINRHRNNMIKSSKVFSEQLFHSYDYTVLFVNDRIVKYAEKMSEKSKFKQAVDLLFNP
ncbi:hypothetical protein [Mucilaginibacter sp.]|jgi:hypothetical protein|uniref:hypothetical protein n=1 Tax=Mucilaginibacter sp. TaxID=1882438 RepID=UPI0026200BBD|nr:hypothetical protein [Mucilaginibacter sp.]MDB4926606.1 hypothetical protein [Mucilaginibacter sp.]